MIEGDHPCDGRGRSRRPPDLRVRIAMFVVLALALVVGAAYALRPTELATVDAAPVDLTMRVDMVGFAPATLTAPAGRPIRVRIVNPDNPLHADGAGIHGFTVEKLGIDARIQPQTTGVVTIPPSAAGEYLFYCDTCCGGKENPAMQGTLQIKA